jgi:hypothetical protein
MPDISFDLQVATLVTGSYGYADQKPVHWDHQNDSKDSIGVKWFIKKIGYIWFVVFPGTENLVELLKDFDAIPVEDHVLGLVHMGFMWGMHDTWSTIDHIIGKDPFIVGGHSMGAAHATLFTGLAVARKRPPLRRVVFGEPLSGFARQAELVSRVPSVSYCAFDDTGKDPIPSLPPAIGYARASPLTDIRVKVTPEAIDAMPPLPNLPLHYLPGYVRALENLANERV